MNAQPFVNQLIALSVVVDPVGLAPMFAALTQGGSDAYRKSMATRGVTIAGLLLLAFGFLGDALLHLLGIGFAAFQIAGGILLLLLAIDMLFARHSGLRSTTKTEAREAELSHDISVFPLAIPLIAGPGAFTTVLLMLRTAHEQTRQVLASIGALLLVLAMTLLALRAAGRILRIIGETGANVVSRVLGVLLSALAIQFILNGLRSGLLHP